MPKRTIRKPRISCKRKYGIKTSRIKRQKKRRTLRKVFGYLGGAQISCNSWFGIETCRVRRCNLKNIDVRVGDPYRILNLSRHTINSIHFYAEISNLREDCVYVFGLTRANGVKLIGDGAALMIQDARLSKVSKDYGLKSGEILTTRDIRPTIGELTGRIDHLQKKIIDIFNERSIIYTVDGKNHARIAYLDIQFDLFGICLSDIPGNYTYQINEPSTVNCRKGAVLFHNQPEMLLNIVDEHLVNHNKPGNEPNFESNAKKTDSLPKYEYSPELLEQSGPEPAPGSEPAPEPEPAPGPEPEPELAPPVVARIYTLEPEPEPEPEDDNQAYYTPPTSPRNIPRNIPSLSPHVRDLGSTSPDVRELGSTSPRPFSPLPTPQQKI